MRRGQAAVALAAVVTLTGCATLTVGSRHTTAAGERARAEAYERDGALRAALNATRVALTLDPADAAARALKSRLEARIEREVADQMQQARAALARHAPLDARRHFLAVLALDPSNAAAFDGLRNEIKEVRFIAHVVRPGETLTSIAQRYYGDPSRSEVIWELNQLPANPKLAVGATLRVPEIPGVPFLVGPGGEPPREDVTPEVNPLLAEARDALDRREFAEALSDVDRVLAGNPRHPEGLELKKSILYTVGKTRLGEKRYEESFTALSQLARLAPGYEDAGDLTRQARSGLVQQRYNEGLRLYREERLEQAIAEWKSVLELEPRHPNARKNIEQAELILRKLQERAKR